MHNIKICNHNYKEILNNEVEKPMTAVEKSPPLLLVILISDESPKFSFW